MDIGDFVQKYDENLHEQRETRQNEGNRAAHFVST